MRYHKDIGFPSTLIFPSKVGKLIYTDHALEKGLNLKFYGWIHGIRKIKFETIIEVVTDDDINVKEIVLRLPYQKGLDANFALELKANSGIVKTIWLNKKNDNHATLHRSCYHVPKGGNGQAKETLLEALARPLAVPEYVTSYLKQTK